MADQNGSSRLDRIERMIENLAVNIESLHANLSELYGIAQEQGRSLDKLNRSVETLMAETRQDAEHIRALARIAEIHDRRLSDLEGEE